MSYPQRAEAQMSQYRTAFTTTANLVLCCLANSHTSWNNLPFVWGGNTNFEKAEITQTLHCSYLASTHSPRCAYLHCPAHWSAHRLAVPIVGHPRITTSVRSSMRFRRASVSSYALSALHKSFVFFLDHHCRTDRHNSFSWKRLSQVYLYKLSGISQEKQPALQTQLAGQTQSNPRRSRTSRTRSDLKAKILMAGPN